MSFIANRPSFATIVQLKAGGYLSVRSQSVLVTSGDVNHIHVTPVYHDHPMTFHENEAERFDIYAGG